ncbi:hypothetical protein BDR26DRAFT_583793 [Obelidium mucronatum]|nr:hypothetical protein BDR26DRAFT_583793 [Obelidium mucronatum]
MSMPSIFSLVGSVSASAGLNKSGNSSRITPEKSAPTLDAISEAGNGEEKADEMPKLDDSMKQASQYNRILQDLSSSSKSEGNMEIAASCPTLDGFSLRSSKKACGSGLQHAIPHKLGPVHGLQIFKLALNRRKCEVCDGSFLKMGDSLKPTKCTECGATFHLGCESNQPPSCGLPRDVRNSLFPANPSFGLSTSSISLFSKLKPSGRVSDGKASTRLVFHAHDGDHFATKEFVDAVNPDIHPPTPPLSRKKKNSGQSSALMKSVNRFSSAGSLGQHVENVDSKNYNYQLYDLQKSRVFGSTRAVSGIETDTLGKKVDFDSKATLNVGASRDLSSVH